MDVLFEPNAILRVRAKRDYASISLFLFIRGGHWYSFVASSSPPAVLEGYCWLFCSPWLTEALQVLEEGPEAAHDAFSETM